MRQDKTLKETVIEELGQNVYNKLNDEIKKEIDEIDKLRNLSEKKKISIDDLIPA